MVINNNGETIGDLKLYLDYPDEVIREFQVDESLDANSLKTITIMNIDGGFEKGTLKTECSTIQLDFTEENGSLTEV